MGATSSGRKRCFECQISNLNHALSRPGGPCIDDSNHVLAESSERQWSTHGFEARQKRTAGDLTAQDLEAMSEAGEQVIDLLAAINTLLGGWHEWYGFDVDRQAVAGYEKLFERGYATRQHYDAWHYIAWGV